MSITGSGTASSKNVANGVTITQGNLGTLALGGSDAGSYNINTIALNNLLTVDIAKKSVNLNGSRTYDGTKTVNSSIISSIGGTIGTETLTISGSGTLNLAGAGSRTIASEGTLALGNGTNGGVGANYKIDGGTHSVTINPKPVTITGTKQYDGDTVVHSNSTEAQINLGVVGESLLWTGNGISASANVGTQNVATGTWALADQVSAASNYTFSGASMTIDITPRPVRLTGTRQYDGTTDVDGGTIASYTAQGTFSNGGSSDIFNTSGSFSSGQLVLSNGTRETLTTSGTGTSDSKDAGVASTINSNGSGLSLVNGTNGGLAANYTLTLPSGSHGYSITPKVLGLSGSKVYDGGSVVLASELPTISGLVGSETVVTGNQTTTSTSLSTGARKNVASNVAVQSNASGITVSNGSNGGLAANYTLTGGTHQVNITKAPVSVALSRQYDGSTNASSNATDSNTSETFSGLVGSETLTLSGQGSVSSKNYSASTQAVTLGSLAIGDQSGATLSSGGLASNYNFTSATLAINKKVLNSNSSRVYNATTTAAASDISFTNQISGETLVKSNAAATSSANAGTYSISNLSGITISDEAGASASSGALASNYTLTGGTHTFNINRKSVDIVGSRQYDGSTNIVASDITGITDTVNSETLTMAGGFGTASSANVGTYNLTDTSAGSLTLGNGVGGSAGLAANYTLTGGSQTYTITKKVLNLSRV